MNHIEEHPHAFIRRSDKRVVQVAVFETCEDDENINGINEAVEGDTFVVSGCAAGQYPPLHGTWDGKKFSPADTDYLIKIKLLTPPTKE